MAVKSQTPKRLPICPVPWIGGKRGYLVDWLTQLWVRCKRQRLDRAANAWLMAPFGERDGIGAGFFDRLAAHDGLNIETDIPGAGLVESLSSLDGPAFDATKVTASVRHFYEHTSEYELELWSQWCSLFRPFGWMLSFTFSRRLQQLNLPISPLDASPGITSEIITMSDAVTGERRLTGWLRTFRKTKQVIYVGFYSPCTSPSGEALLKVAFPLPNGNAVVIMRPSVEENGTLTLTSSGDKVGDPGFYLIVAVDDKQVAVRYLRSMREQIRVYEAEDGLRADHVLKLFGITFLRMHYRLRKS